MAASNAELDQYLAPPAPGAENLCFLVGAGISHDLASTPNVIEALLRVLFSELGDIEAPLLTNRLLSQSIGSRQVENPIRFEYLLQVVKDYFQANFHFLKRLYDTPQSPNSYHLTLARVALGSRHVVFTTNFDRQIERAARSFDHTGFPLRVAFRDSHFRDLVSDGSLQGLLKLHGSVHDVRSLGATFGATTLRGHQEKRCALETGLMRGSLCVIGYSGSDDTDVVPTIRETAALDHCIYWFRYDPCKEPVAFRFDRPGEIPAALKDTAVYRILEKTVRAGMRRAEKVILIEGRTEDAVRRFFDLRGMEFKHGPSGRAPSLEEVEKVIRAHWFEKQGEHRGILAMLTGIVLSYIVGVDYAPQELARKLDELTKNDPEWRAIAWPKLAMAAYDVDENAEAARLAKLGKEALGAYELGQSIGDAHGRRKALLRSEAKIDSHVWLAEALRMQGQLPEAIEIAQEGLEGVKVKRLGSSWKRLRRLKGDLLSAIGESHLDFGHFKEAEKAYRLALVEYNRAAEWNWYWYARLGLADIQKTAGNLASAGMEYAAIKEGSADTGWRTWLYLQIRLSEFDILRVQATHLDDGQVSELNWMAATENEYDDVQRLTAKALRWDLAWIHGDSNNSEAEGAFVDLLKEVDDDEDTVASLRLSHAEFCKHAGDLDGAEKDIHFVREFAARKTYHLLGLHARCILADVIRLRGRPIDWVSLAQEYRQVWCPIGELYATAIGNLGGAEVAPATVARLSEYARTNKLALPETLLRKEVYPNTQRLSFPLLFPGF